MQCRIVRILVHCLHRPLKCERSVLHADFISSSNWRIRFTPMRAVFGLISNPMKDRPVKAPRCRS